jgi:CubicO group peptidase (beta-lactamase class C family)
MYRTFGLTIPRLLIAAALFVDCAILHAQTPSTADLGHRVDTLAEKLLPRVAGISIAVARDGKVVSARGYGMANVQHSVAVTPETVFHIDSISKNILSAVLLQLADQGKLNLDDDVTKYVPEAPTQGRRVTVRQLLNHTSGIYSFTSLPEAEANERLDLSHEQVLGLFKNKPFTFEPGAAWRYNNSAFYIAGMVVERVTRQEYAAYVREHVFKPLGMTSAQMCDAARRRISPPDTIAITAPRSITISELKLPFAAAIC